MNPLTGTTTAFIGCGAMGEAMLAGMLGQQLVEPAQLIASHPRRERREQLAERHGLVVTADNREAALAASIVVLTVKPQLIPRIMSELRGQLRPDQVVVSICAGVDLESLATGLLHPNLVRAMPNTPAQIGQGLTVWTATTPVGAVQRAQVKAILASLGREIWVDDEHHVAMATALSASGPAYYFLVMEAMIDAGVHLGFSRRLAQELVVETMRGAVLFAEQTGKHPAELRNMVTSPGGTTAAALYEMEKGGLRTILSKAVYAAYRRTLELSQGGGKRSTT